MSAPHLDSTALPLFVALVLMGCGQGVLETGYVDGPGNPGKPGDVDGPSGPGSPSIPPLKACSVINVDLPLADSILGSTAVEVKGNVEAMEGIVPEFVAVDDTPAPVIDGRFSVTVERPAGAHTLVVRCADQSASREFRVRLGPPRVVLETPATGTVIDPDVETIDVTGYVENHQGVASVSLNGAQIALDERGRFRIGFQPRMGMNHLDLAATTDDGLSHDIRHSFLRGKLARFESDPGSKVSIEVRQSAFDKLTSALERELTDDVLEDMLDEHMGRHGDIQLHEIKYDRLEIDFIPQSDRMRVRLKMHDFGLKFTYHYFLGRIRGWARVRPAEIEANLDIRMTADGGYDLAIRDPQVNLRNFDLDLNDLYSLIEGLVQPMVHDMGRDALMSVMRGMVIEDIIEADLLNQPIEMLGQSTTLQMTLEELNVRPSGITALANATVAPFEAVKQLPGIWTAGANQLPSAGEGDLFAGMSVDVFNRLAAHAVRGGLLDVDLATLLGDDLGATLSVGVLAGVTGADLMSVFAVDAPIALHSEATMQPVVQIIEVPTVGFGVSLGGFRITLSSPNAEGQSIPWAVLELSGMFKILPTFVDGQFELSVEMAPRIEVVDAPLMPLDENAFEDFLETLLEGMAGSVLDAQANEAFDFAGIDLFGLKMRNAHLAFDPATPDFVLFGVELGRR